MKPPIANTSDTNQIEFSTYCQRLYQKGLVYATAGNVSIRCPENSGFIITPSGCCLGDIQSGDGVWIRSDGSFEPSSGGMEPSTEWLIHQRIYEARESIHAVVHAHPPKATGFALAGVPLDRKLLAEVLLVLGEVPVIPYILPGSQVLADAVYDVMKTHHAVLLGNHGVITTGDSLRDAYYRMELIESLSETILAAKQLGEMKELTEAQVQEIYQVKGHVPLA